MAARKLMAAALSAVAAACVMPRPAIPAARVFVNARIHTFADPPVADSLAVDAEGRILAVGNAHRWIGPSTQVVDLGGATVVPGLADAHAHLESLGRSLFIVDLTGARSYEEMVRRVERWAQEHPEAEWILGRGWNQELWPGEQMPDHAELSRRLPDRPVWLRRVDGHAALANAAAMRRAGITRGTPPPPGGEILRDESGEPTGVFIDAAMNLLDRHIPPPSAAEIERNLLAAQARCLEVGLTFVHDAGTDRATWEALRRLRAGGHWKLRVYAMHPGLAPADQEPQIDPVLTMRSIKVFLDGALGSRGAWLLAPYADRPDSCGLNLMAPEEFRALVRAAAARGWQVAAHAIGDRANRLALDVFAEVDPALRMRIEHAQVVAPEDLSRFARHGVIASMQPSHATSDMNMAEQRLGPRRILGAYAWRTILESGAVLAAGSDFPVENPDPLWGIYAAVTRQDHEGKPPGGWYPDQRLTREEAFRAFTQGAAWAAFREGDLGRLASGYWADFVVYEEDVLSCPVRDLVRIRPVRTVIAGETVYGRGSGR